MKSIKQLREPRDALLQDAARWLKRLLRHPLTYTLARDGCVDSLVTVTVEFNVKSLLRLPVDYEEGLKLLREAIDVLYLLLALDPEFLWTYQGGDTRKAKDMDTEAVERYGHFQLCVKLYTMHLEDTSQLERHLCRFFVQSLDEKPSMCPPFLQIRRDLEKALDAAKPNWRNRLDTFPVKLQFSVITSRDFNRPEHEWEAYLKSLVDFATYAGSIEQAKGKLEPVEEGLRHVPLIIDHVRLTFHPFLINARIVEELKRLKRIRKGFVVCERAFVDPRMVIGSHQDVTDILNALAAGRDGKRLLVETGPRNAEPMDTDNVDRTALCDTIIRGIAACNQVTHVDLGGMIGLFQSPAMRRSIYRSMFQYLLPRWMSCSLDFSSATFQRSDTDAVHQEHVSWRRAHPNGVLRVKELCLETDQHDNTFATEMVAIVDDVEQLEIQNFHERASFLPATTLTMVVAKFTNLRKLCLYQLEIASLDILLQSRSPQLEELRLTNFLLIDRTSLRRFFHSLGDPVNLLSRSLRLLSLCVHDFGGTVDRAFRMTLDEVDDVRLALEKNDVLSHFEIFALVPPEQVDRVSKRLHETDGRRVRATLSELEQKDELRRRLAFLSVIEAQRTSSVGRLDEAIANQIFHFAAAAVKRVVKVYFSHNGDTVQS